MRALVSILALLAGVALGLAADDPPSDKKKPPAAKEDASAKKDDTSLKVGKPLPGPFPLYNVTGPYKHRYHCIISEHDLDPMVMIFVKNVDTADPLSSLLKRLDTAIDKNSSARLGAFVVFLPEDLPDVSGSNDKTKNEDTNTKNDDARIELENKLEGAAADMKLKNVVLCLANKSDVEKYGLSDANLITAVLYSKLNVAAIHALPKSDFTASAIEKIMTDVADKLGAKRK
jgi:hypothetical protein